MDRQTDRQRDGQTDRHLSIPQMDTYNTIPQIDTYNTIKCVLKCTFFPDVQNEDSQETASQLLNVIDIVALQAVDEGLYIREEIGKFKSCES